MSDLVIAGCIQLTNASVRFPGLGQLHHLIWRQDCASAPNQSISAHQIPIKTRVTYLTLFFPFNRLWREAMVRPAGRGGGSGASGARESTWVTEGVSGGGGLEGRPRGPGVAVLAAAAGREDDASSGGGVGTRLRRPFNVGSSSAASSASWSESISAEVGAPLASFLDFAGVDLPFFLSAMGAGGFFGETSMRNSGRCSDRTHRRRPRCTPRSPTRV